MTAAMPSSGRVDVRRPGGSIASRAPAADMFERGIHVQVLRRGTRFHVKAKRLHDIYRRHAGLAELPAEDRE